MAGFIYIMSNPAFPNLIKIGKSRKDPTTDRVSELNQTGVPQPFKVEYYALVENENYLEQELHEFYDSQRPNKSREFFSVDCSEAIKTIRSLSEANSSIIAEKVFYPFPKGREEEDKKVQQMKYTKNLMYRFIVIFIVFTSLWIVGFMASGYSILASIVSGLSVGGLTSLLLWGIIEIFIKFFLRPFINM